MYIYIYIYRFHPIKAFLSYQNTKALLEDLQIYCSYFFFYPLAKFYLYQFLRCFLIGQHENSHFIFLKVHLCIFYKKLFGQSRREIFKDLHSKDKLKEINKIHEPIFFEKVALLLITNENQNSIFFFDSRFQI